jgi:hypothetical protein
LDRECGFLNLPETDALLRATSLRGS